MAQEERNPVSSAVPATVARQPANLIGAIEEMPIPHQSGWRFAAGRPHCPPNTFRCSKISNTPAPAEEEPAKSAPTVDWSAHGRASFDYCTQPTAKLDDSNVRAGYFYVVAGRYR